MKEAHYGFDIAPITRGKGHSIVKAGAYQLNQPIYDQRADETWDFRRYNKSRNSETLAAALLTPEGVGAWADTRESFYNTIERVCNRSNSQLGRWGRVNIPREIPADQRMEMVTEFIQREFVSLGMCADIALQTVPAADGLENPHAHFVLTMRHIMPDGSLSKRAGNGREWNDLFTIGKNSEIRAEGFANRKGPGDGWVRNTSGLETLREKWANHVNEWLQKNDSDARCSHLSYKARGINRKPQPYIGKAKYDPDKALEAHRAVQQVKMGNLLNWLGEKPVDSLHHQEVQTVEQAHLAKQQLNRSRPRGGGRQWSYEEEWLPDR